MKPITKERIFNSNELYLLQNFEAILLNINLKIAEQENRKNEISCFWDTVESIPNIDYKKKDYAYEINNISEKFIKNIEKLNSLKTLLIDIHNSFISLSKISVSDKFANDLSEKINLYFSTYTEIEKEITITDMEVDHFVKTLNSLNDSVTTNSFENCSEENIQNNNTLIISEEENKVFLPYTISEIKSYMEKYPKEYKSFEYVVNKEFVLPLDYYTKHPSLTRFREAYSLIRDREAKSVFDALKYALNIMFKYDLNPAIISACKTEEALNLYIECLENKDLSKFDLFKIEFKLNPLQLSKFETNF